MPEIVDRITQRGSIIITTTINWFQPTSLSLEILWRPVVLSQSGTQQLGIIIPQNFVWNRQNDKFTFKIGTKKLKINTFKCWKWQHNWYNYMIRSYSFQNSRAFPMACATFETTAQKTLGTLACSAIYNSFSWNASLVFNRGRHYEQVHAFVT